MHRYAETYFRHPRLLLLPILIAVVIASAFAAVQPPKYESVARLWIDSSPSDTATWDAYTSPADREAAVLAELLNSRSFALRVAHRGSLYSYLVSHRQNTSIVSKATDQLARLGIGGTALNGSADDAAYNMVTMDVKGAPSGPQIVTLTVDFTDPEVARSTAQAVVDQFHDDTLQDQRDQVQAAADFYTKQVADEKTQVATADDSIAQYLASRPELRLPNAPADATLSNLQQADALIRQRYDSLAQKLDGEKLSLAQLNAPGSASFRVIDEANQPTQPITSKKALAFAIGGGLVAGLILTLLLLVLLTLADTTIRRPGEVDRLLGLRLIGTVPRAPKEAA
jgi:uncharacterized protein involved in exopolysaccharide biosynthesis